MKRFLILLSAIALSSCATEKNIKLNENFWQQKKHKVAVVSVKPAKPGVTTIGNQGLLGMAINHGMTHELDSHLEKLNLAWYDTLPKEMAAKLKDHHVAALVSNDSEGDEKQIANIAAAENANEILVIRLNAVGVVRRYQGFIPLGAPEAYSVLKGELIDASTKEIKWRHLAEVKLPVPGNWDQPPTYPNVTVAVNQAISTSRQEILDSFFSGN